MGIVSEIAREAGYAEVINRVRMHLSAARSNGEPQEIIDALEKIVKDLDEWFTGV